MPVLVLVCLIILAVGFVALIIDSFFVAKNGSLSKEMFSWRWNTAEMLGVVIIIFNSITVGILVFYWVGGFTKEAKELTGTLINGQAVTHGQNMFWFALMAVGVSGLIFVMIWLGVGELFHKFLDKSKK